MGRRFQKRRRMSSLNSVRQAGGARKESPLRPPRLPFFAFEDTMTHAIRQLAIPALLCTLGTVCATAHAASGTITFNGSVTSETCAPTMSAVGPVGGKQDFTVTLPSV